MEFFIRLPRMNNSSSAAVIQLRNERTRIVVGCNDTTLLSLFVPIQYSEAVQQVLKGLYDYPCLLKGPIHFSILLHQIKGFTDKLHLVAGLKGLSDVPY